MRFKETILNGDIIKKLIKIIEKNNSVFDGMILIWK